MCEKVNKITVTLKGANLLKSAKYYTKLLSHITCLTGANYCSKLQMKNLDES